MSCQKGNTLRTRPQKHQNRMVFKNNLNDTSKKTKIINSLEVAEVCKRCHDVIEWKIKYKKYKLLSQPKTCIKCNKKTIKNSYHLVCVECARIMDICCKCGKKEEIVAYQTVTEQEKARTIAEIENELKVLPERKRRAYHRYMDKIDGKRKKKKKLAKQLGQCEKNFEDNNDDIETLEDSITNHSEEQKLIVPKLTAEEYIMCARKKLEELKKMVNDDETLSNLDDLDLSDEVND